MSDTPKTDAMDAAFTKMLDGIIGVGGPSSWETVIEAARTMMKGYGQLCEQLERDLTEARSRYVPQPAWIPVSKDDQRFHRGSYVAGGSAYAATVRSNGEGYDHFVIELPPLPDRRTCEPQPVQKLSGDIPSA